MGNRAIVIFKDQNEIGQQVYLHWNGGPESIFAFLVEMKRRGHLSRGPDYVTARFCAVVADFMRQCGENFSSDGLSLGLFDAPKSLTKKEIEKLSHGDSGVYVVNLGQDNIDVDWHNNTCKTLTEDNISKVLKSEGKRYKPEYQDQPQKKYDAILEFFVKLETILRKAA